MNEPLQMAEISSSIPDIGFHYGRTGACGIELLDLGSFRRRAGSYRNAPDRAHRILFHCLLFPAYAGTHEIDFKSVAFEPDDIVYVGPGQVHAWNFTHCMSGSGLLVSEEFMRRIAPLLPTHLLFDLRRSGRLRCGAARLRLLSQILALLNSELQSGIPGKELELPVAHLLRMINPEKNEDAVPKDLEQFRRFCELVEEHCTQTRRVCFYADSLSMTSETLNRLVRKMSSVSAKRWIDRCVVLQAQRRLVSEEISVDRLSADMGFSQPTHFVKFFCRLAGETPGSFQRGKRR